MVNPSHPIAEGLDAYFEIPEAEMYGELFDIPTPDDLVFISWFEGGNVFRSGCCWHRGRGKVFYFRPGHETYPIYHMPDGPPGHRQRRPLGRAGERAGLYLQPGCHPRDRAAGGGVGEGEQSGADWVGGGGIELKFITFLEALSFQEGTRLSHRSKNVIDH